MNKPNKIDEEKCRNCGRETKQGYKYCNNAHCEFQVTPTETVEEEKIFKPAGSCPECKLRNKSVRTGNLCYECFSTPSTPTWEEELLSACIYNNLEDYDENREPTRWKLNYDKLKSFISNLISKERAEALEEGYSDGQANLGFNEGYEQGFHKGCQEERRALREWVESKKPILWNENINRYIENVAVTNFINKLLDHLNSNERN